MTQEDKALLLKDLCARLPYGVKFPIECWNDDLSQFNEQAFTLYSINTDLYCQASEGDGNIYNIYIEDVKPYLFPMSSMNEEQKEEFNARTFEIMFGETVCKKNDEMGYVKLMEFDLNFYNTHHLDWRGLIPKGLAIDATGLNIY